MINKKKPFYGEKTKKKIVEEYLNTSATMDELAKLHGILGSNTVADWIRKYGNLSTKNSNKSINMKKLPSSTEEKSKRSKRYKSNEHLYICSLESDLATTKERLQFYMYKMIKKDPKRKKYKIGIERFFGILRKHNLLVKRRKRRVITTDSSNWRRQYPNLIIGIIPHRPEQILVADITYFKTKEGPAYGHFITDAYSKKIMGFVVADNMVHIPQTSDPSIPFLSAPPIPLSSDPPIGIKC